MKTDIHPKLVALKVILSDGITNFVTYSPLGNTKRAKFDDNGDAVIHLDSDPTSHSAWQKNKRVIKKAGRVSKFIKQVGSTQSFFTFGLTNLEGEKKDDQNENN